MNKRLSIFLIVFMLLFLSSFIFANSDCTLNFKIDYKVNESGWSVNDFGAYTADIGDNIENNYFKFSSQATSWVRGRSFSDNNPLFIAIVYTDKHNLEIENYFDLYMGNFFESKRKSQNYFNDLRQFKISPSFNIDETSIKGVNYKITVDKHNNNTLGNFANKRYDFSNNPLFDDEFNNAYIYVVDHGGFLFSWADYANFKADTLFTESRRAVAKGLINYNCGDFEESSENLDSVIKKLIADGKTDDEIISSLSDDHSLESIKAELEKQKKIEPTITKEEFIKPTLSIDFKDKIIDSNIICERKVCYYKEWRDVPIIVKTDYIDSQIVFKINKLTPDYKNKIVFPDYLSNVPIVPSTISLGENLDYEISTPQEINDNLKITNNNNDNYFVAVMQKDAAENITNDFLFFINLSDVDFNKLIEYKSYQKIINNIYCPDCPINDILFLEDVDVNIVCDTFKVAPIKAEPLPGSYPEAQVITLSTETSDVNIYYTLDGSDPNQSSTLYFDDGTQNDTIVISETKTLKARAYKEGMTESEIFTGEYKIIIPGKETVSKPTATPPAGTYDNTQNVILSTDTLDTNIYYTVNGTDPSKENGNLYTTAIVIGQTTNLKAIAYKDGWNPSEPFEGEYKIIIPEIETVSKPTATPGEGTYNATQNVTLSTTTPNANIYFTTDDTDPSKDNGTLYTTPIVIAKTTNLKARAYKEGMNHSEDFIGKYKIEEEFCIVKNEDDQKEEDDKDDVQLKECPFEGEFKPLCDFNIFDLNKEIGVDKVAMVTGQASTSVEKTYFLELKKRYDSHKNQDTVIKNRGPYKLFFSELDNFDLTDDEKIMFFAMIGGESSFGWPTPAGDNETSFGLLQINQPAWKNESAFNKLKDYLPSDVNGLNEYYAFFEEAKVDSNKSLYLGYAVLKYNLYNANSKITDFKNYTVIDKLFVLFYAHQFNIGDTIKFFNHVKIPQDKSKVIINCDPDAENIWGHDDNANVLRQSKDYYKLGCAATVGSVRKLAWYLYAKNMVSEFNQNLSSNTDDGDSSNTNNLQDTKTCSEGYILVPGNPEYGLDDFCVAKYEMKMDFTGDGVGETPALYPTCIENHNVWDYSKDTFVLPSEPSNLFSSETKSNKVGLSIAGYYLDSDNHNNFRVRIKNDWKDRDCNVKNYWTHTEHRGLFLVGVFMTDEDIKNGFDLYKLNSFVFNGLKNRGDGDDEANGFLTKWNRKEDIEYSPGMNISRMFIISASGYFHYGKYASLDLANYSDLSKDYTNLYIYLVDQCGFWSSYSSSGNFQIFNTEKDDVASAHVYFGQFYYNCSGGSIVSSAKGSPITNISQTEAIAACKEIGGELITNNHWMTIARNIEQVPSNWSGNAVGSGYIYSGHNDLDPYMALEASVDSDGYVGTGENESLNQRRTLTLTNGEVIWDFAGNVFEWTNNVINPDNFPLAFFDINGNIKDGKHFFAAYGPSDPIYESYISGNNLGDQSSLVYKDLFLSTSDSYNINHGVGTIYLQKNKTGNRAFSRGGSWRSEHTAGILSLDFDYSPLDLYDDVGLRCVK